MFNSNIIFYKKENELNLMLSKSANEMKVRMEVMMQRSANVVATDLHSVVQLASTRSNVKGHRDLFLVRPL